MVRVAVRWSLVAIRMSSDDGCAAWSIALGLSACAAPQCVSRAYLTKTAGCQKWHRQMVVPTSAIQAGAQQDRQPRARVVRSI